MTPEEVMSAALTRALQDAGLRVDSVQILRVPRPAAAQPPAPPCEGPHYAAPCCGAELCFHDTIWQGKRVADLEPSACCPVCASFLRREGASFTELAFHVMTTDEVVALTDAERIRLQRARQVVETLRARRL
jgi:hypothetical protein